MTDQQRIEDVLRAHARRVDFNHPAYGLCRCGFDPDGDWPEHAAAKVAGALAPDIDKVAQAMDAELDRQIGDLPDRYGEWINPNDLARAAVAAMGWVRADDETGGAR